VKAVVFQGIGEVPLDEAPAPTIEQPTDAIWRFTAGALCRWCAGACRR
jgi:hypothetical protein